MPRLDQKVLRCAFYLYHSEDDAKAGVKFGGTGFVVAINSGVSDAERHYYGITNWHVACRDGASVVRVQKKDGDVDVFNFDPSEWHFRPGWHDIAAIPLPLDPAVHDFSTVPIQNGIVDHAIVEKAEIGAGEDVLMIGRFIDSDGVAKNSPSTRFGNISMMPQEGIKQPNGCTLESYVVDMHSRTGYSGSPVFAFRTMGQDLRNPKELVITDGGYEQFFLFLGIHWGQFPEYWEIEDREKATAYREAEPLILGVSKNQIKGMSGMTCVIPAWRIAEMLEDKKLRNQRENADKALLSELSQKGHPPIAESTPPATEDNPSHKEDFNRLLGVAARTPKSAG